MVTFGGAVGYSDLEEMPIPEFYRLSVVSDRINKLRESS